MKGELSPLQLLQNLISEFSAGNLLAGKCKVQAPDLHLGQESYSLDKIKHVHFLAIGKAAMGLGRALEKILKQLPPAIQYSGMVIANSFEGEEKNFDARVEVIMGNHPIPLQKSFMAGEKAWQFVKNFSPDSLAIFAISGGGSSILEMPLPGVPPAFISKVGQELLKTGATIQEMNLVRQSLSAIKAGRLLTNSRSQINVGMIVSDIPDRDLSWVSSGPTFASEINSQLVLDIAKKYLSAHSWHEYKMLFEQGQLAFASSRPAGKIINMGIGSAHDLLASVKNNFEEIFPGNCQSLGVLNLNFEQGMEKIWQVLLTCDFSHPGCLISGGELPVHVVGEGVGGRNTHFVLASAKRIMQSTQLALWQAKDFEVFSLASDGRDGETDCAGAKVSKNEILRWQQLGIDPQSFLHNCDSYNFFKQQDGLIAGTPVSHTNLMDVRVIFWQ